MKAYGEVYRDTFDGEVVMVVSESVVGKMGSPSTHWHVLILVQAQDKSYGGIGNVRLRDMTSHLGQWKRLDG